MENNRIRDDQITASSQWNSNHQAANGRLNFRAHLGKKGGWSAKAKDLNQWLQVDFRQSTIITGISTQGRHDANQYVMAYKISFRDDATIFHCYKAKGIVKVTFINEIHTIQ